MPNNEKRGLSRRKLLSLGALGTGGALIAPLAASPEAAAAPAPGPTSEERPVTVSEITNVAAAASPDGKSIAFDLYGVLWVMDVEGGPARRLTDDFGDVAQPDWTPDSQALVFQSYRTGNFQIWSIKADGTGLKQLTEGPFDCREPRVSPDGKRVAFSSDRNGSYGIYALDLATGAISTLVDSEAEEYEPCWSPDGSEIAFTSNRSKIEAVKLATGARRTVAEAVTAGELHGAAYSPDGAEIYYTAVTTGACRLMKGNEAAVPEADVYPFRITWLSPTEFLYTADGQFRRATGGASRAIAFSATVMVRPQTYAKKKRDWDSTAPKPVVGIGSPVLSPDGRKVAFRALNDIYVLTIGGKAEPLTRDGFHKETPAWSPDGKTLAYSSDRGGKLDIWLRDLATGADRQLTRLADAAVSASWSNDGTMLAFLDQTGSVYTVEVATGAVQKIHGPLWEPGRPTWSPDGKVVALSAFKPYSARYREGLSEILTIERATGKATYAPVAEHRSIGTRGDDGPVWSPDGASIAFVLGSRLHTAPVDAAGKIAGPIKALNQETTDAPSWSGDSKSILYLSNGKLRLIPAAGGAARTINHGLTWARAKPRGLTLVRAGRLWDGRSPEVKTDVDILIDGNRIVSVKPRGDAPAGAKVVDATGLTVMPGLLDMHTHRQMQGYSYGDKQGRLWLAFGITATRSPGSPAYHCIEERESIDSGARIGPRYFTTGEAIDGSRIYYNFMRPVSEPGQLELELQRAEALGYDLLKSYVRAPLQQQKAVAEWGHARGIHTTSHYHYPAFQFGLDCMEHLGATSRFGYSRTVSPAGAGYEDVISLFAHSGSRRTPTLFTASTLLEEDPGLQNDVRIRTLYPTWERKKLQDRTRAAQTSDQTMTRASLARNVAQVKDMLKAGAKVIAGTDAPIDLNVIALHMNLRAMVKYGVSPYEALLTATRYAAEFMAEPLGVVEAGALADLAMVEGDPLRRIEDAAKVKLVMKNGEVFTVDQLLEPFARTAAAERHDHGIRLAALPPHPDNAAYWWHDEEYLETARHACCADIMGLGVFAKVTKARTGFTAEAV